MFWRGHLLGFIENDLTKKEKYFLNCQQKKDLFKKRKKRILLLKFLNPIIRAYAILV